MIGKVIDINNTEAFVTLVDGTTMDIGLAHLSPNLKLGDTIEIPVITTEMTNDKLTNFF